MLPVSKEVLRGEPDLADDSEEDEIGSFATYSASAPLNFKLGVKLSRRSLPLPPKTAHNSKRKTGPKFR